MNRTRAHLTVDIADFAPNMYEYLPESATPILSANGALAMVYLTQKKNCKRLSKLYLLIDLKTAQAKCAGLQSERERFAFLEARDDHLFRIRAWPERVRIDLLRVDAHWKLEVVRTIARYRSALRLCSITIDSLRQGFLIREKNGNAPGLGTLTERFELALLDGRRLLLKKTRRDWSFMASPERSRFRFAGSGFHYTFGDLSRANVATVNCRTHKMRFRESKGVFELASDRFGVFAMQNNALQLVSLHSRKLARKAQIAPDSWVKHEPESSARVIRNDLYLELSGKLLRYDTSSGCPVLLSWVRLWAPDAGLKPLSVGLTRSRFLTVAEGGDVERLFPKYRWFWRRKRSRPFLADPSLKVSLRTTGALNLRCKSMAADEAEGTLYLLCEACAYHGSVFSQRPQQIEVVVFRKRSRRASTLLLSSFEAGPGPRKTRHQILLSLDLETDKLTYQVVTSNFELDLLRASDTLLVFGVSAQGEAAMQALRSASRLVHPERRAAGAESGRSARLPAVLIAPNLSRRL
ncbi:MAG: hypothetical protein AAF368_10135, partial [Planctomycetota bacterium]